MVIVQDPNDAQYDGMPQSALGTGMVDVVLPLSEIPAKLLALAESLQKVTLPVDEESLSEDQRNLLHKIFAQIRTGVGRDFTRYKRSTIMRRIGRRMQLAQITNLGDYLQKLRNDSQEVQSLADDLLITVTNFFRDSEVFGFLEQEIVPKLFQDNGADEEVRIWSVGCATGEEAYSLAIILLEEASKVETPPKILIFASDLHQHSLGRARNGFYPGDIATDVSPERLKRFFVKEDGGNRIRNEVRDLVVFTPHNLMGDPPFSRLDFISCSYDNALIHEQFIWSPELFKILQLPKSTPVDRNIFLNLIHPDDKNEFLAGFQKAIEPDGQDRHDRQFRVIIDGETRWLRDVGHTFFTDGPNGKRAVRIVGKVQDITAQKDHEASREQARAAAEAANRSRGEFLANMSHEIRTPMTAILGHIDILSEMLDGPEQRKYLETVRENGKFLLGILNDILDLSKIDAGKLNIEREPVELARLLAEVRSLMNVRAMEKGVGLSIEFGSLVPLSIKSDAIRLRQILLNLLGNAIKFTELGTVRLVVTWLEETSQLRYWIWTIPVKRPKRSEYNQFPD